MESRYNVEEVESRIYKTWEDSGYFNPDKCVSDGITAPDAEHFSIVLPPPNVTGNLHMGHAAMLVIEDIMVRYARMCGKRTLWVPGTDHAAIATQSKYESLLYKKEGKNRYDLGREEFLKQVQEFALSNQETIIKQTRRMGSSLNWSRLAFTLDEKREIAVRTAFKQLYDLGLIVQGGRIVNWDPKMQTTVSDDEIEWLEETVPLYYLKYGPFEIATARPETKFGDKFVVMHPDDPRYAQYSHGQIIGPFEWINGPVSATIIKDPIIDMEFGTGAMTITPDHDATDYELSLRHNLPHEPVIDLRGKMLPIAGKDFEGLSIKKARALVVERLQTKGLISRIEEKYVHRIATNSRGGGIIEPQILKQWFISVNKEFVLPYSELEGIKSGETTTLKKLMRLAVESQQINVLPERFEKIYYHWIDNLRDWCISRQIWYGHRIPVWYRNSGQTTKQEIYVGTTAPKGDGWEQDPDTLDTWFSSGLWTFSTLGWPDKNAADLKAFHPTSIMETGYDILFFWVARMILMTTTLLGQVPFRTVYLHGLVRDEKGRKMSKSLNNGIDPLEMAEKYGADATRMSLIVGAGPGNDIRLSEDKIRGYRNFGTKVWNASRFVWMNKPENEDWKTAQLNEEQKKSIEEFAAAKNEITSHLDKYELHMAAEKAYHYFWHTFADVIIEREKDALKSEDTAAKNAAFRCLHEILTESLKMLHPFIPFVTEEIWQQLNPGKPLMVQKW
jgi:valyl-tRNA synthetase